jgi:hypothetical protein
MIPFRAILTHGPTEGTAAFFNYYDMDTGQQIELWPTDRLSVESAVVSVPSPGTDVSVYFVEGDPNSFNDQDLILRAYLLEGGVTTFDALHERGLPGRPLRARFGVPTDAFVRVNGTVYRP